MRYKSGNPKTLYALTSQSDGVTIVFTNKRIRDEEAHLAMQQEEITTATYDLREKK